MPKVFSKNIFTDFSAFFEVPNKIFNFRKLSNSGYPDEKRTQGKLCFSNAVNAKIFVDNAKSSTTFLSTNR